MSLFEFNNDLLHNMVIHDFAASKNITIKEARSIISTMSFSEYHKLCEGANITPPSGNTIGPSSQMQKKPTVPSTSAPTNDTQSTWTGKGPVQIGMTVGVNGPNNVPSQRSVSRVDSNTNGVVVKDPVTGKEETMNIADLQPFMAQTQTQNTQSTGPTTENSDLMRLRELAGIKENCSAGATAAGAIAIAPAAMGTKKRQATDEELKKEYTRTAPAKTIAGDTKPSQASGELSANLAASGKISANRRVRK